jgi:hypothetical protein
MLGESQVNSGNDRLKLKFTQHLLCIQLGAKKQKNPGGLGRGFLKLIFFWVNQF